MINNGEKDLPIDRYPYMENDLKLISGQRKKIKVITENYADVITYINPKIEEISEFRLYDCGNFYYCLFKCIFSEDVEIGERLRLCRIDEKYKASLPSQGIVNQEFFIGRVSYNGINFDVFKVFDIDIVELSHIGAAPGLIFSFWWLK